MRLMISMPVLAATLLMGSAALADGPPAPAAPAARGGSHPWQGACPTGHARRFRARHVHRAAHRSMMVRVAGTEHAYNPEDDGVSASQAWVYRYELSRGGLDPWEVNDGPALGERWRHVEQDSDDRGYGRDSHVMADGEEDNDGPRPLPRGRVYGQEDERSGGYSGYSSGGYAYGGEQSSSQQERYASGGGYTSQEGYASSGEHAEADDHHQRHGHRMEQVHEGYGDSDDSGHDWREGDRYSGGSSTAGGSSHYQYERREADLSGGSVRGENDGQRYGWSWGDQGHGDGARVADEGDWDGGHSAYSRSERHLMSGADAGGYAHRSGGGYAYSEEGGSTGWHSDSDSDRDGDWDGDRDRDGAQNGDRDDHHWRPGQGGGYEVYRAAGRDTNGYLVWAGKPRAEQ